MTTDDNGTYTLYAIWQAEAVAYKVNFRVQSVASARAGSTDLATAFVNFTADTISTTANAGTEVTIETLMNAFESKYGVYKLAEHDIISSAGEGNYIVQGDGSLVIDVYYTRGTYDVTITIGTGIASVTVKGASDPAGVSRYEWEHEIPVPDALELLQLCEPGRIDKTRHYVPCGAHLWEVDEFHGDNEGLVLAEIELHSPDEPFARPSWLGEEVTGDPRYYNAALAACPFRCWHSRP